MITKVKLMNGKQIVINEKIIFQTIGTRIDHICTSNKNFEKSITNKRIVFLVAIFYAIIKSLLYDNYHNAKLKRVFQRVFHMCMWRPCIIFC